MPDIDPITGQPVHVVEVQPGSADDPLLNQPAAASAPVVVETPSAAAPVLDGQPGAEVTATPAAAKTDDGTPPDGQFTPEELEALKHLNEFLQGEREATEAQARKAQSSYDRQITTLKSELESRDAETKRMADAVRELQAKGLSEEEAAKLRETWANDDRKAGLDQFEASLNEMHVSLARTILLYDYQEFGVTEDTLAAAATIEEMESVCKDAAIEFLTKNPQATATPNGATAQPAPAPKPAPAGAERKTDSGGGGAPPETPKFNEAQGVDAMLQNLKSMKPATVIIKQ